MKHVILMNFCWRIISHTTTIQAERCSTNGIPAETVEKRFLTRGRYGEIPIMYICIKRCVKMYKREEAHLNLLLSYCFYAMKKLICTTTNTGFITGNDELRISRVEF